MKRFWAVCLAFLTGAAAPAAAETADPGLHSFTATTIDGRERPLSEYRGKALLVVNTASRCGFTPQYGSLEKLYETYRGRGFEVLAFPSNDFMGQEPGTNAQIREFCALRYGTTFPLFAKIRVKGEDAHPLYRYLTSRPGLEGAISWNFNKFLVDPRGKVTARFGSKTDPMSSELVSELEKILPA